EPEDLPHHRGRRDAAVPGGRPDAPHGAGRLALDAVRRDVPDVSPRRPGDVRKRRGVAPPYHPHMDAATADALLAAAQETRGAMRSRDDDAVERGERWYPETR